MRSTIVALAVALMSSCSGNDGPPIGSALSTGGAAPPSAAPGGEQPPGATGAVPGDAGGSTSPASPPPGCALPAAANHAAVCVSLRPEAIDLAADPGFDGKGTLWIAAYQSPLATAASLLRETYVGSAAAPVDVRALPESVRLEVPAGTVYLRVVLFDGAFAPAETPSAGWWVGGYDITGGVAGAQLVPVATVAGASQSVDVDLWLLRKLVVKVQRSPSVYPVGDGRGPLRAFASPVQSLDTQKAITFFGEAGSPCGNVSGSGSATLGGYVMGKGPYWIFAMLDDFGVGGLGPDGSLISIAGTTPTAILLPAQNVIAYAPGAPIVSTTVVLGTAVPRKTPAPDIVTCP